MQGTTPIPNRRRHLRQKVYTVAYVNMERDMGGILVDVSEAGMGVQTVARIETNQVVQFEFTLTGSEARVHGTTEIAWANSSGQAGLKFLNVSEEARHKLKDWLLVNALTSWNPPPDVVVPEVRTPKIATVAAAPVPSRPRMVREAPAHHHRAVLSHHARAVGKLGQRRAPAEPAVQPGKVIGPLPMTRAIIEDKVASHSPGVFVLGITEERRGFDVAKVGRSDDLKVSLADYLGKYAHFQYVYCLSELEAFEKECQVYHQFRPRDNKSHPTRRFGTDWDCPVCHGFS
jgi:hypothetical protein